MMRVTLTTLILGAAIAHGRRFPDKDIKIKINADIKIDDGEYDGGYDGDNEGKNWAILIAGSDDWDNYRHQADVCHSYQVLKRHGIPDERIIVLMKDDIAYHPDNPYPGRIFNGPTSSVEPFDGPDVYHGVPKDYTGDDFTVSVLWDVFEGRNPGRGSGKTLKSTARDNIFIFYSDHGSVGLSSLPSGAGGALLATKLYEVIDSMGRAGRFNKMLIYWEACHSGSMFNKRIPPNVLAVTAAREDENSWAKYRSSFGTYLGDQFSVSWMEDSDQRGDLTRTTVGEQIDIVKRKVTKSHVMVFGDRSLLDYKLSDFLGSASAKAIPPPPISNLKPPNSVSQQDVALNIPLHTRPHETQEQARHRLITARNTMLETILAILRPVVSEEELDTPPSYNADLLTPEAMDNCYYPLVNAFSKNCFSMDCNYYFYEVVSHFIKACTGKNKNYYHGPFDQVMSSMQSICSGALDRGHDVCRFD